jgi:hypothetical protein
MDVALAGHRPDFQLAADIIGCARADWDEIGKRAAIQYSFISLARDVGKVGREDRKQQSHKGT